MEIKKVINEFVSYAINNNLIEDLDVIYVINTLEGILKLEEEIPFTLQKETRIIDDILDDLINYGVDNKIFEEGNIAHDLVDTMIMDVVTPYPSTVVKEFFKLYKENKEEATNYFYNLMVNVNYIRLNRIKKNIGFTYKSNYGEMLITINLSKPEKDPRDIAKLKLVKTNNIKYPKCLLCYENMGFVGNMNLQARNNIRFIPVTLNNDQFYMQYSPYIYYNEHCIVFKREHEDMKINDDTFRRLLDFVDFLPHYFLGSNADIPIVGGSILVHEHYQGGRFTFPLDKATVRYEKKIGNVDVRYLNWPLDTIELVSENKNELLNIAFRIHSLWRGYRNDAINIIDVDSEGIHNTITPIARKDNGKYILKLVLRNNKTTKEYPYGLYHPSEDLHHIKKENIGLIEVMGLAILPARLKEELKILDEIIKGKRKDTDIDLIPNHKDWYLELKNKKDVNLNDEVGKKFVKVLECCGVFRYGTIQDVIKFIETI